jgi:ABC-type metal ion transport system substrate-binding protein
MKKRLKMVEVQTKSLENNNIDLSGVLDIISHTYIGKRVLEQQHDMILREQQAKSNELRSYTNILDARHHSLPKEKHTC